MGQVDIPRLLEKRRHAKRTLSKLLTYKVGRTSLFERDVPAQAREFGLTATTSEDLIMDLTNLIDDIDEDLKASGYRLPRWESIRGRED